MAAYELTTGIDTIVGTSGSDTVYAGAATLNAGDQLTGGGGTDVLTLYGPGDFHVDRLATFTGFSTSTSLTFTLDDLAATTIEVFGTTRLDQVANEFFLRDGVGNGPSLKFAGADVVAGQFGTWTPVGVEKVGSGYQVVWKNGSADQYIVWNVDGGGNWLSQGAMLSGSDYAFQSLETPFQQDLNADGTTGLKTTLIETSGTTRLDQVANEFFLRDGVGNGPSLKFAGADVVAGQFGAWTPIGTEKIGGGYQVVWKNGSADQYIVWNVDGGGNWLSQGAVLSGSGYAFQSLETPFQQDLNADGTTGLKTTPIETSGATRLDQVANEFFLRGGVGNGPSLKFAGADVVAGQFGAWTPLGVEKVGSGYQVVWKNGGADQYIVWNVDGGGNWLSQGAMLSGSSAAVVALEAAFSQDFNGVGGIAARTVIETAGSTNLSQVANAYMVAPGGGTVGPLIKAGDIAVTVGQFGGWTPIAAEQIGSGYQVVWKNGTGAASQYVAWGLDGDGNYLSQGMAVAGSTWWVQAFESVMQQDLNGDLTTGPVTALIESSGGTTLTQVADSYFFNYGTSNVQLRYGGSYAAAGQFGAWTPIAVELSGGRYQMAWKNGGADQYVSWTVDAGGNFMGQSVAVAGSTWWVQSYEPVVQFDLNSDGLIGPTITPIEASGASSLTKVADSYFINYGGANVQVLYGGSYAGAGQFGSWTPVGAEQTVGGDIVMWKNGAADQYLVWNTDAGGNYMWQSGGTMSASSAVMQALEASFQQDFNGNGFASRSTIEASGATVLSNVAGYLLLDSAGSLSGPLLSFSNQYVTATQFGTAKGAEWVGNGYMVAWQTAADTYNFWGTDVAGQYAWQSGNLSGSSAQMQAFENTFQQDLNSDGVIGVNSTPFNIQIVYTGNSAYQSYFTLAAQRWEKIIRADLPGMTDSRYGFIDDLRIDATVRYIDGTNGTLGQAGPDALRPGSSLPYHGIMEFDSADLGSMAANGTLLNVILHEMGHVLGLGTLWSYKGLSSGSSYWGTNALNAYWQVGGTGSVVPLETTGGSGTRFVHWSEAVFDNELMTGFVEAAGVPMPLSIVTIGSLQDLGYTVDYGQADAYRLPGRLTTDAEVAAAESASDSASDITPPANGEGVAGASVASTTIESDGASTLIHDENHYFIDAIGDDWVPPLSYAGVAVTEGEFGDWTPIGVEQTASGYQVAWKMAGEDQYIVWQTDSAGQWLSQTAAMSGGSAALQSLEVGFSQDLNGDGVTGLHLVEIEAQGATSLFGVADGYSLQTAEDSFGAQLKFDGAAVTAGQFGGWVPIAAEQTASGYEVAWKMDGADQFIVWQTDSNGNWVSQSTVMAVNSGELKAYEQGFAQDLDGDGIVGPEHETASGANVQLADNSLANWMMH